MHTTNSSHRKVYNDRLVWLVTLIGGPLAGGFIIAENFRMIGDKHNAKKAWMYTIPATIIMLVVMVYFWNKTDMTRSFIFAAYSVIAGVLVSRYQSAKIITYIAQGGKMHQLWLSITVGLAGLFISLLLTKACLQMLQIN